MVLMKKKLQTKQHPPAWTFGGVSQGLLRDNGFDDGHRIPGFHGIKKGQELGLELGMDTPHSPTPQIKLSIQKPEYTDNT